MGFEKIKKEFSFADVVLEYMEIENLKAGHRIGWKPPYDLLILRGMSAGGERKSGRLLQNNPHEGLI